MLLRHAIPQNMAARAQLFYFFKVILNYTFHVS